MIFDFETFLVDFDVFLFFLATIRAQFFLAESLPFKYPREWRDVSNKYIAKFLLVLGDLLGHFSCCHLVTSWISFSVNWTWELCGLPTFLVGFVVTFLPGFVVTFLVDFVAFFVGTFNLFIAVATACLGVVPGTVVTSSFAILKICGLIVGVLGLVGFIILIAFSRASGTDILGFACKIFSATAEIAISLISLVFILLGPNSFLVKGPVAFNIVFAFFCAFFLEIFGILLTICSATALTALFEAVDWNFSNKLKFWE